MMDLLDEDSRAHLVPRPSQEERSSRGSLLRQEKSRDVEDDAGDSGSAPPYALANAFGREGTQIAADRIFGNLKFDRRSRGVDRLTPREATRDLLTAIEWKR
jgi:hypothetical protein